MSLLNKLSKKDALKFSFAVSFDYIDNFKPPRSEGGANSSADSTKKSSGLKLGFGKKKDSAKTPIEDDDIKNYSYAVFWKRGSKRSNHTEFVPYSKMENNRLPLNETFKITGTMFQQKSNKFGKKKLEIEIHQKQLIDPSTTGEKIATGLIDLSEFVSAEKEIEKSTDVKLEFKNKTCTGTVHVTITSTCLKDLKKGDDEFSAVSTFTGVESENDDDATEDDLSARGDGGGGGAGKGKNKVSPEELKKLQQENEELEEQIGHLKRKIQELERQQSGNEDDSSQLIADLQRERDELREKWKKAQMEIEDLKEERDRAQQLVQQFNAEKKIHEEQIKSNSIRQKMQKVFGEKSNVDKDAQKLKAELDATAEKLKELERENLKLQQTANALEEETEKLKVYIYIYTDETIILVNELTPSLTHSLTRQQFQQQQQYDQKP
jgi:cell division septum initiation protein DivIVA